MAWRYSLASLLILLFLGLTADIAGADGYSALRQPVSARATAINGAYIAETGDVSSLLWNPAGLQQINSLRGGISFQQHLLDVNATELLGARPLWKGVIGIGIDYWNYGQFEQRDRQGNITGSDVNAYEGWLTTGYSYPLAENIALGLSLQFFHRNLADHTSTVLFWNLGWQRVYPAQQLSLGITAARWGTHLGSSDLGSEPFPKQLIAGVTKQLAHLPLKLFLDGEYQVNDSAVRALLGGEFTITETDNLFLRFGVSTDRVQQQTQVVGADFFAGTAFGLGFRLGGYQIDYGLQTYGGAGMIHAVTLKNLPLK